MKKEKMLKPLPCPFCGQIPWVVPSQPEIEGNAWGAVDCQNPSCRVNPTCSDGAKRADDRGSEAYKQLAIRNWNRRHSGLGTYGMRIESKTLADSETKRKKISLL